MNYPPEIPPELVAMAGTATAIASGGIGGTAVVGLPTNTFVPSLTPTPGGPTATSVPPTPTHTPVGPTTSFSDTLWNDVDGDFSQDPGEGAIAGMPVELHVNPPFAIATTNSSGFFFFDDVPLGTYFLKFIAPPGFSFNAESGINPATGETAPFTLT